MNYLFFDIECCDGRNICEFGYVIADKDFNVIERQCITIDPKAPFHLPPRDPSHPFQLSYPQDVYLSSPDFAYYYERIRKLITDSELTVVGFSIFNDIIFLYNACQKYGLPFLDFSYIDIQRLYFLIEGRKQQISLSAAVSSLNIPLDGLTFHNSCDDSEYTVKVAKELTLSLGVSLTELADRFEQCKGSVTEGHGRYNDTQYRQLPNGNISDGSFIDNNFELILNRAKRYTPIQYKGNQLRGNLICFSEQLERYDTMRAVALIILIRQYGGRYTQSAGKCNMYIHVPRFHDGKRSFSFRHRVFNKRRRTNKSIVMHSLSSLLEMLSLSQDHLDNMKIPSLEQLFPEAELKIRARFNETLLLNSLGKTERAVFEYLTRIPSGKVVTYGQIAEHLGDKHLARVVGNILHKNPDENRYPCYRVVNYVGKLSEGYAFGGIKAQRLRLLADGIEVNNDRVDLGKYKWTIQKDGE